jgi:hypothetical protein
VTPADPRQALAAQHLVQHLSAEDSVLAKHNERSAGFGPGQSSKALAAPPEALEPLGPALEGAADAPAPER